MSQIQHLSIPERRDLNNIQCFNASNHMKSSLIGLDWNTWGTFLNPQDYKPDIVCLRQRKTEDVFSNFVLQNSETIFKLFGRFMKPSRFLGKVSIRDDSIFRVTFWVTSMLAATMPVASVAVLPKLALASWGAKIGTMTGFNAVTALLLNCLTDAKRAELFIVLTL